MEGVDSEDDDPQTLQDTDDGPLYDGYGDPWCKVSMRIMTSTSGKMK